MSWSPVCRCIADRSEGACCIQMGSAANRYALARSAKHQREYLKQHYARTADNRQYLSHINPRPIVELNKDRSTLRGETTLSGASTWACEFLAIASSVSEWLGLNRCATYGGSMQYGGRVHSAPNLPNHLCYSKCKPTERDSIIGRVITGSFTVFGARRYDGVDVR